MTPSHVSKPFTQGIPSSQQVGYPAAYRANERKGEFNGVVLLALLGALAFWAGAGWLIARCFR